MALQSADDMLQALELHQQAIDSFFNDPPTPVGIQRWYDAPYVFVKPTRIIVQQRKGLMRKNKTNALDIIGSQCLLLELEPNSRLKSFIKEQPFTGHDLHELVDYLEVASRMSKLKLLISN